MNHTKIVNDALNDLLVATFPGITVSMAVQDQEFKPEFKKGEFIEFWLIEQPYVSGNSDGEDREFIYGINHYFNGYHFKRTDFEDLYMDRYETLKKALMENRSYYSGGSYIWHDAKIDSPQFLSLSDEWSHVKYYNTEFSFVRFNQW